MIKIVKKASEKDVSAVKNVVVPVVTKTIVHSGIKKCYCDIFETIIANGSMEVRIAI